MQEAPFGKMPTTRVLRRIFFLLTRYRLLVVRTHAPAMQAQVSIAGVPRENTTPQTLPPGFPPSRQTILDLTGHKMTNNFLRISILTSQLSLKRSNNPGSSSGK